MTDPQKRYLFRLLGAQGVQGKDAEAHLKQYFPAALAAFAVRGIGLDSREAPRYSPSRRNQERPRS